MLERGLLAHEVELTRQAEAFVRKNHRNEGGHDHSHVLAVTDYAIRIAQQTAEAADPFVVVMGALFHDLGRIGAANGLLHGLKGAAVAREWLYSTDVPGEVRERILKVIARHTPTTGVPPETVEERVVYDADALDRLGIIGMLRGLMGRRGSTGHIIEDRIQKRLGDYDRLHFAVSRRMGEALHADTIEVVGRFREALEDEVRQLHRIPWPVSDGVEVPIPSLGEAAESEGAGDLTLAMAKVEAEAEIGTPRGHGVLTLHPRAGEAKPGSPRLSAREAALRESVAKFVRENHSDQTAHDYAHVLTVVKNSLRIARSTREATDPVVLLCGALFHDIGWVAAENGAEHGLRGASLANEFLASTWLPEGTRASIRRVVVRHSFSSGQPPETAEERIVWDADGLAGVGLIGVARGIIGGVGSMGDVIEACLRYAGKRAEYLHFEESRRIAASLRADSRSLIRRFVAALQQRKKQVETLRLPI